MPVRKSAAVPLFALLILSGCAEKWAKPGATSEEFDAMKATCMSRSAGRFPPMMRQVQITNGYTTPITTNCNGFGYSVNCYTTGGQYVPPVAITVDDNQGARNQDTRACFFENGWHPVKDDEQASVTSQPTSAPSSRSCPANNVRCTNDDGKITCGCGAPP